MLQRIRVRSVAETRRIARMLSVGLRGGDVVALIGELGAGKSTFANGLAAGLGIRQRLRSPTFVTLSAYRTHRPGATVLFHADLYRQHTPGRLDTAALIDAIQTPRAIVMIEWADRMPRLLTSLRRAKRLTVIRFQIRPAGRDLLLSGRLMRPGSKLRSPRP